MAVTATPIFVQTGFGSPVEIAASAVITNMATGAGATDVITGGANGSQVKAIEFFCATESVATPDARMLIYHDSGGTKRLVGEIPIAATARTKQKQGWSATWPNNQTGPLKNGDKYCAGPTVAASVVYHARAIGGDY